MYVCMYVCMYIYIYIYMHAYAHTFLLLLQGGLPELFELLFLLRLAVRICCAL